VSATLTMVPLAKIKARKGFNPRSDFADEQMEELVESVRQHGIITPLTLAPDGDGFVIVAGERRYHAAKQAKLKEVPVQVRDADGDALTLAVAENVIRTDLNPVEEARGAVAYTSNTRLMIGFSSCGRTTSSSRKLPICSDLLLHSLGRVWATATPSTP
jgi:ParB/RepB/Spo0J family partition protein